MTTFTSIRLRNWRQFAHVSIEFHPRLTIITGSNGAGKSTVLNICAQHFGYAKPLLSTPRKKKGGGIAYDLGYYRPHKLSDDSSIFEEDLTEEFGEDDEEQLSLLASLPFDEELPINNLEPGQFVEVGSLTYSNNIEAAIGFAEQQAQAYGLQINNQQQVFGVPISSHRTISAYQQVQGLSLQLVTISNAYQAFFVEYINRMNGAHSQFSPLYRMKETLIAMAAFGEGNRHLERNEELYVAFEGFSAILRKILPKEIGFQRILVRVPDIVLKTRSGEFILDSSSGGVTAIIEITWQLYLFSLFNQSFAVTLDEPENHLHPSMQRSILPSLIDAFPQGQFIVATHSPFIVSAVEDSRVYALKYMGSVGESGFPNHGTRRVRSILLDQKDRAGDASEILKEVLGVRVSIPDWASKRLESIIAEFENSEITSEVLKQLRARLASGGFSEFFPDALNRLVQR